MMYCHKCLHQQPEGTIFCDVCGTSLLSSLPMTGSPTPNSLAAHSQQSLRQDLTPSTPVSTISYPSVSGVQAATDGSHDEGLATRIRLRLSGGKAFHLTGKTSYVIGRRGDEYAAPPDVDLADWDGAAAGVSRTHAAIRITRNGIFIEDLNSTNETIQNSYRLLPRQLYPLADGDQLRLGALMLIVTIS
jgi:pSer/pThr/pTyr-binding forkhead associated (FHA) protein